MIGVLLVILGIVVGVLAMAVFSVFSKKLADKITEFIAKQLFVVADFLRRVADKCGDWLYGLGNKLSGMY